MTKNKAIVLLSGGLDSLVSVASLRDTVCIERALYFDYGQKPRDAEKAACEKICAHYDIELEVIELPWFARISGGSALSAHQVDTDASESKAFWIPNRNGLFVNIGAAYAESLGCKYVVIGANKEEAQSFIDNSVEFVENATALFSTSTQNSVELLAPLIEMDKVEIVKRAVALDVPLEYVFSCYFGGAKNCGRCPSCLLLKQALLEIDRLDLKNKLF